MDANCNLSYIYANLCFDCKIKESDNKFCSLKKKYEILILRVYVLTFVFH